MATTKPNKTVIGLGVTLAVMLVTIAVAYAIAHVVCMEHWTRVNSALQVAARATPPTPFSTRMQPPMRALLQRREVMPSASTARKATEYLRALHDLVRMETPLPPDIVPQVIISGNHDKTNPRLQQIAMVVQDGDTTWVVFRSTATRAEWDADFKFQQTEDGVHLGFWEMFMEIRDQVREATRGAKQIVMTGHSLGGVLAVLSAIDAATQIQAPLALYIFGSPRVGDQRVVDAAMLAIPELYVFANDADIVPSLPLSVQPNLEQPDKPWFYSQLPTLHFHDNKGSWALNHSMLTYIEHLP